MSIVLFVVLVDVISLLRTVVAVCVSMLSILINMKMNFFTTRSLIQREKIYRTYIGKFYGNQDKIFFANKR